MTLPGAPLPLAHGRWPESPGEWAFWVVSAAATAWVLWKCVAWTVRPGEDAPDHVKRSILDDPAPAPPPPGTPASPPR